MNKLDHARCCWMHLKVYVVLSFQSKCSELFVFTVHKLVSFQSYFCYAFASKYRFSIVCGQEIRNWFFSLCFEVVLSFHAMDPSYNYHVKHDENQNINKKIMLMQTKYLWINELIDDNIWWSVIKKAFAANVVIWIPKAFPAGNFTVNWCLNGVIRRKFYVHFRECCLLGGVL